MPPTWEGHPLRKDHPARATEMGPFQLPDEKQEREQEALQFHPEEWGLERHGEDTDFMFLNLGPQHPGHTRRAAHRLATGRRRDRRRGARDRLPPPRGGKDGRAPDLAHLHPLHRPGRLSGRRDEQPALRPGGREAGRDRGARSERKVIRVMMAELFRIVQPSGLVRHLCAGRRRSCHPCSTCSPTASASSTSWRRSCGGRMHPSWFRIGGVAQDLPNGWDKLVRDFLDYLPARLNEYDTMVMENRIFKARTEGVGSYTLDEAIEWGVTGPGLRATGLEWDFRKKRPYSGYDQFEFDIPTASTAIATTGPWCVSRRCARACASSSSAWTICRLALTNPTTR